MAEIRDLDELTFQAALDAAEKPLLVDFWAVWCGPCGMLAPIMQQIADEEADRLEVARVNVDQCPTLAAQFGISSIPALILFKGGEAVAGTVGAKPKESIMQQFEEYL